MLLFLFVEYNIIRDIIDAQTNLNIDLFFQKLQKKKNLFQIEIKKTIILIKNNNRKNDRDYDRNRQ